MCAEADSENFIPVRTTVFELCIASGNFGMYEDIIIFMSLFVLYKGDLSIQIIHHSQGRTQGEGPGLPLGPEKHHIFRVSAVKVRDLQLWSLFFMLFAMWEDWGNLQHGK